MDCKTPEEMIITLISQNRGTKNFIQKSELIEIAIQNGLEVDSKMDKKDIAVTLAEKIGYAELAKLASVGVSSLELQKKFGITNNEVKKMAKGGFITVVGTESFRMYGKTCHADLYSPYDYFKSEEEVISWLVEQSKKVNKNKG